MDLLNSKQVFASSAESVAVVVLVADFSKDVCLLTCSVFFASFASDNVSDLGWQALTPTLIPKRKISPIVSDNMFFCMDSIPLVNAKKVKANNGDSYL